MKAPKRRTGAAARSAARLSAVQALYQMELAGTDLNEVIHQFTEARIDSAEDDGTDDDARDGVVIDGADMTFFADLLRGVVRLQGEIDPVIDKRLAEGWRLVRVDATVRQILRAALYELIDRPDVPARAVVNEYIEVAKAFFDGDEPKLVNGILDQLARTYRAEELARARGAGKPPVASADSETR